MDVTTVLGGETAQFEHFDLGVSRTGKNLMRDLHEAVALGHLAGTGVLAAGRSRDEEKAGRARLILMPLLREVDGVLRGDPIDREIVIGVGETWTRLAGLGAFSVVAVGIPGGIGDPLKLASQRLEGRILKLLEKPFAELGLVEGRIGRALPCFWNGQGELLLQEMGRSKLGTQGGHAGSGMALARSDHYLLIPHEPYLPAALSMEQSMSTIPTVRLNDGNAMPQFGYGVWRVSNEEAASAVGEAIKAGYRSIDTAAIYGNEEGVGQAIKSAPVAREELFITTKVWNDRHGYDDTLRAFDESLARLKLDHVDLYLIHWPVAGSEAYLDTWRALIKLKQDGRAKSIGVSNFMVQHLQRLSDETGVTPSVNQIELHPRFQQTELREFHAANGIATESWSPLGQGTLIADETLAAIGRKYGKTPAQVILRWHLDNGLVVIPKSVTPSRMRENIDVFDFNLDSEDMRVIEALDDASGRVGPDPAVFG
jgi:diketogulonate reductase-like aldo/keto reductase